MNTYQAKGQTARHLQFTAGHASEPYDLGRKNEENKVDWETNRLTIDNVHQTLSKNNGNRSMEIEMTMTSSLTHKTMEKNRN